MKDFRQTKSCSLLCLILSLILLLAAGCGKTGPDGAGKDALSDGGKGAVRDIIEQVLKVQDNWMKDFENHLW